MADVEFEVWKKFVQVVLITTLNVKAFLPQAAIEIPSSYSVERNESSNCEARATPSGCTSKCNQVRYNGDGPEFSGRIGSKIICRYALCIKFASEVSRLEVWGVILLLIEVRRQ